MRKLAYFAVILLIIGFVWAVVALVNAGVKSASVGFWSLVLGSGYTVICGGLNKIVTLATTNSLAFLVYTLGVLIFSLAFWAGMRKLWNYGSGWFGKAKTKVSSTSSTLASATGITTQTPSGATTRPTKTATQPTLPPETGTEQETVKDEVTEA